MRNTSTLLQLTSVIKSSLPHCW